ncbi:MAG: hypothetical protein WB524_09025 [Acidobacteriaceae bacterium]
MAPHEGISGPHLTAAFLCEKILTERDGVASFIRIVDRFTIPVMPQLPPGVELPPGVQLPAPTIQFNLVIMLKSGDLGASKHTMKVTLVRPDGIEMPSQAFSVFFNGSDDNGVAVISPMALPKPEEGLYWFDVYFETHLITRVPMRVFYQEMQMMQGPPNR